MRQKIAVLESDSRFASQNLAVMDEEVCKEILKEWWQTSSKTLTFRCDKVELAGIIARRNPAELVAQMIATFKEP